MHELILNYYLPIDNILKNTYYTLHNEINCIYKYTHYITIVCTYLIKKICIYNL